jgi:deazaflavin-dependent oxidoreductase (nitroreductase family)
MLQPLLKWMGATRVGVWTIKRVVAPLDRRLYRLTGGRVLTAGRPVAPTLLLTTVGRRTGKQRTNPVFYLCDGNCIVICNVNPGFEQPNPWILNIGANPDVQVQVGAQTEQVRARVATPQEIESYWPQLVQMWPAYDRHFERSGQRAIFVLEPLGAKDEVAPTGSS